VNIWIWSDYQKDPLLCPPGGTRPRTPATGGVGDGSADDGDGATGGEQDSASGVVDVTAGVLLDSSSGVSAEGWTSSSVCSLFVVDRVVRGKMGLGENGSFCGPF
jgi:hypothetical protein